jgi:hypothetical protein
MLLSVEQILRTLQKVRRFRKSGSNVQESTFVWSFSPLNAELNTICHLLALLRAHHILHVSRIRVKATGFGDTFTKIEKNRENFTMILAPRWRDKL